MPLVLKGIVHPKMKILSFTHPQVVPNLYECVCSAEHKGRYSEECGKQSSSGSYYFFFSYYGSQWCPKTAWLQTFFKISSFVFSRTKTFIQVWNYLRVSKWWQNFHFWVNYPFNIICCFFEGHWLFLVICSCMSPWFVLSCEDRNPSVPVCSVVSLHLLHGDAEIQNNCVNQTQTVTDIKNQGNANHMILFKWNSFCRVEYM